MTSIHSPRSGSIGPYRILGVISVGGMGEIYRAVDSRRESEVALKMLPLLNERNAQLERQFLRETRIHQDLSHPNLVKVLDAGMEDGEH